MSRTHEDFSRVHQARTPGNRAFGWTFSALLLALGLWPLLRHAAARWWLVGLAAALGAVTALAPALLGPLNRLWHRFGLLLHRVVSPVLLALIFFLVLTPMSFLMRLFGRDTMQRRHTPAKESYWIEREPPGPEPATMARQF